MSLSTNTVDKSLATVCGLDQVDKTLELGIDAIEAAKRTGSESPYINSDFRDILVVVDVEDSIRVRGTSGGECEVYETGTENVGEYRGAEGTIFVEDFVDNILEDDVRTDRVFLWHLHYSPKSELCPCSGQQRC